MQLQWLPGSPQDHQRKELEYLFYTAVFKLIERRQPIFRTFTFSYLDSQNFLFPFGIDPKNYICCQLPDDTVIAYRIVDDIDKKNWIDFVQGAVLPFFNLRKDLICYIKNKAF